MANKNDPHVNKYYTIWFYDIETDKLVRQYNFYGTLTDAFKKAEAMCGYDEYWLWS